MLDYEPNIVLADKDLDYTVLSALNAERSENGHR